MHLKRTLSLLWSTLLFTAVSGQAAINTVTTAVPFLTISPDARCGGMGNVGIAVSPDANASQLNGARMAFAERDFGIGASFQPWIESLTNLYLANLNGFYKIRDKYGSQTIHASLRYLSLGEVSYVNGGNSFAEHPKEFYCDAGYARRLNKIVSVDATVRFIYAQNLPTGPSIQEVKPGMSSAADLSALVDKTFANKGKAKVAHELLWGICISNIGSKMTYTSAVYKDFLPCNLGIGFGYKLHIDPNDMHTLGFYADLNKLLVPTPNQPYGGTAASPDGYEYSAKEINESPITGMITSFYTAPGGAQEELKFITEQVGIEYYLMKMYSFRVGYFSQDPANRGRQYATVGTGFKYRFAALHLCYMIPVYSQHNPYDNTFSISLAFEFNKGKLKKKDARAKSQNT